ncbi:MAG TPA: alpha/beta hydrolase-fold protein, partial [Steroidobacteraceae bacterium]|nr:alpha/beta hydrolase-fold protein [Steroidobacteraceae bacterium]
VPFGGNGPPGLKMSKAVDGIWSVTTDKAVDPDNYRYTFLVDGATVPDPQATTFKNQRAGTRSTFEMPGEAGKFQSYNPAIAHGVVSVFEYWSKSLGVKRRAHIYTPPGYMNDAKRYPVLYLVHGAGDSDDEWTATGHAQYILDNLIAAGKAKPMIIVMPFGHTPERPPQPPVGGGVGGSAGNGANLLGNQDFGNDLLKDLIPAIDASLRTKAQPQFRAMAGLSMGGGHTLQFGLPHSDVFRYIGVFSMGLGNAENAVSYEKAHVDALKKSAREMKLVYYAIGKEDFLYASVAPTRAMLDRQGIQHVYHESGGGHVWINWRAYLNDFAPRLFQ